MRRLALLAIALVLPAHGQTAEARGWADHWAYAYGLQRELIYAVIEAESGWDPSAVSQAGAVGLMQLMPDTAVAFRVGNRFDIAENVRGGVAYLAQLAVQCKGDWRLAVASYNAGPPRVLRQGLRYYGEAVQAHVQRVAYLYRRNRWEALLREGGN